MAACFFVLYPHKTPPASCHGNRGGSFCRYICEPCRDHPCMCGEKLFEMGGNPDKWGSPLRMRGKGTQSFFTKFFAGITPAYAGKRSPPPCASGSRRDHPRVRGEKRLATKRKWSVTGSSPRMRGKAKCLCRIHSALRITPACAGKRVPRVYGSSAPGDHPRVCGEKIASRYAVHWTFGSPPRVRGRDRQTALQSR